MVRWCGCFSGSEALPNLAIGATPAPTRTGVSSGLLGVVLALAACGGTDPSTGPNDARKAPLAIAAPSASQWSPLITLSIVPAAAANLPNGKVVLWSAEQRFSFSAGGRTYTTVFDPATGTASEVLVTNTGHNMFCPGTSNLADGRLLISGGIDSAKTSLYNATTGTWSVAAQMNIPRGYNANCVLEDGAVLTLGGSWSGGVGNKHGEVWTEASGWRQLAGVPVDPMLSVDPSGEAYGGDSHLWLVTAGNGRVFHAGPGVEMHWIGTQGTGSVTSAGLRGDDEFSVNGNVVIYDVGKLLKTGGVHGYVGFNTNANAYVIDINAAAQVRKIAPMAYPRAYHNSVVLPNGQVVIVGGQTFAKTFSDDNSVLRSELFDPVTETFTLLPPMALGRNYHSVALLLPDARVLTAGGGLCGDGCSANHEEVQILTPHYLLNTDGSAATRPVIVSAPAAATHGTKIAVTTDSAVGAFSLVRLSSNTHAVNNDQRRIPLGFTTTAANAYELSVPSNPGVVVPGYYMLFAMNAAGVPSVAKTVQITGAGAPKITHPGDQAGVANSAVSVAVNATNATSFSATGLPNGLAINAGTGTISGTPSQPGNFTATLSASNAVATTSTTLQWTIGVPGAGYRYVRLEALSEVNGNTWTSMAEFNLLDSNGAAMPRTGWTVSADSEAVSPIPIDSDLAGNAIDGSLVTMWHTQWPGASPPHPHTFTVNLGSVRTVTGFKYRPRNDGVLNGIIAAWRFQSSLDGVNWTPVAQGNFADFGNHFSEKTILFNTVPPPNQPPTLAAPANRSSVSGQAASLALAANDPDGDPLTYSASGLPPGMTLNTASGLISGTPTVASAYVVSVQAADGRGGVANAAFTWTITAPVFTINPVPATPAALGSVVTFTASSNGGAGVQFSWNFGDGSADTAPSSSSVASHAYAAAGLYRVTVTATDGVGTVKTLQFTQAVYRSPSGASRPVHSSNVLLEVRAGASARVWLVNQDNDSVSVFDAVTLGKLGEVAVGAGPRTAAVAGDGRIWVTNKDSASISVISPTTLAVVQTVAMPRATMPFGIAFAPDGNAAYITLEASGQLLKLNPGTGAVVASQSVGANPRHLSIAAASDRVLVSRFITPPLPGEATATVATSVDGAPRGGEVVVVAGATMLVERTVVLQHSDKADSTLQGSGVPNYLAAAVISPDGSSAWVPSKQDNIKRGTLRNAQNLDFQNTLRAISSRIDLSSFAEDYAARVDHDNSGLGSAAVFHPTGAYLFVALQTSRQVAVIDPVRKAEVFRFGTGRAPDGLAISADGLKVYVSNFMDRSLGVFDLTRLVNFGEFNVTSVAVLPAVATEKLAAQVLQGKRLFYDAQDPRLARDGYMSCAACHNEGRHDGRVWDLTGLGEGLRNTISLRGRAGMGQGFLHWSNNFDEVQDFEGQIRNLAGGTGLMSDALFNTGTRSQPLGIAKAGASADLDALAAYLTSLNTFDPSPYRPSATTLSTAATEGKALFASLNCAACHAGASFTQSGSNTLSNIGTVKASSGQRSGAPLTGIDVPTLRDTWATAPYLHDGSAPTLEAAVRAHTVVSASDADLVKVAAYLREIGSDEGPAPVSGGAFTIWSGTTFPAVASTSDTAAVNLGVKFTSEQAGFISGIRFYKGAGNTGTHVGTLWTSAGAPLATATFVNETASGWQQVNFSSPVAITANTVYVASYLAPNGRYAANSGYFASAAFDNAPLHALSTNANGGNGVYAYSASAVFPNATFQSTNYWVDVVFASSGPADTTPPTVTSTSPAAGATGVAATSAATATFSEAIDPATVNASTFEMRDASGALVSAAVSYNASTRVATLVPGATLAPSTTYSATVKGGASDPRVKDSAGNALVVSKVWSFTTVLGDTTPPTVTASSPANGAIGVSATANVTATFSETLDASTINTNTFELRDPSNALVPAAVTFNATTRVATLNPTPTLVLGAVYTATVKGGAADPRVKDAAGNPLATHASWSFTIVPDTAAPTVTAISPADGATTIGRSVNITATFSEAMDAATIGASSFELRGPSNVLVPAVVTYNATNRKATLDPTSTLAAATTFTVTVMGGASDPRVKDAAGNALAASRTWSFTTK